MKTRLTAILRILGIVLLTLFAATPILLALFAPRPTIDAIVRAKIHAQSKPQPPKPAPGPASSTTLTSGPKASPSSDTASVTLAWDPSPSTNVTSYSIYWGPTSGGYTNSINTPDPQTLTATVPNLIRGTTCFFAATARAGPLESPFSNEVQFTIPELPLPPTNLIIVLTTQSSPTPIGPWTNLATLSLTNHPTPTGFFRLQIKSNL